MRSSGGTRLIIFGFILAIGITLIPPHFVFGAARTFGGSVRSKAPRVNGTFGAAHSFGTRRFNAPKIHRQPSFLRPFHDFDSSGRFTAPSVHRKHFFSHPFHGFGFVGVGGVSEEPVIIIQQFQPKAATEPSESASNRIYVAPRWLDGGHGVEVLQPGYWTDPKQAAER